MEQRKRFGGNNGLGYYTSWEKDKDNGCIYCGKPATTREHIPSKAFLIEPFPENLFTIPACFECNNGFSKDEEYMACYLDVLRSYVFQDYVCNENTRQKLQQNESLRELLNRQIEYTDGILKYTYDVDRFKRIITKLAKCHAGFEFDLVDFDRIPDVRFDFIFNLSDEQREAFEQIHLDDKITEVGSRMDNTMCIIQDINTGNAFVFYQWNEIQENQYRYQVFRNAQDGVSVEIVIYELLFCCVDFL